MKKKYNIVFISDLEHSAPRISNFIHYLSKDKNLNVFLVGADYSDFLSDNDLPVDFNIDVKKYLFKRQFKLMSFIRKVYLKLIKSDNSQNKNINISSNSNSNSNSRNFSFKFLLKKIIVRIKIIFVNIYLRLNFPDQYIYTLYKYIKIYKKHFKDVDTLIISSSPYPTSHIAAFCIKKRFKNVKWIADYRDMWTYNHNYSFGTIRKMIDYKLEKFIIGKCDYITTVSEPWASKLSNSFDKKIKIIPNGFSKIKNLDKNFQLSRKNSNKIYFLYVGTISFNIHDVEMFLTGLRKYVKEHPNKLVEVHFCGNYSDSLDILIEKYDLNVVVKQIGRFTRNQVIQMQKTYHYLFYFDCLIDDGVLLLKFFEYINANRPILAFGKNELSESGKILKKLSRGIYFKSNNDFYYFLKNMSLKNKEFVLNSEENEEYSYETQSLKLKHLIKKIY
jgi:hypothetical protein